MELFFFENEFFPKKSAKYPCSADIHASGMQNYMIASNPYLLFLFLIFQKNSTCKRPTNASEARLNRRFLDATILCVFFLAQ
jgi:hypothetical protein